MDKLYVCALLGPRAPPFGIWHMLCVDMLPLAVEQYQPWHSSRAGDGLDSVTHAPHPQVVSRRRTGTNNSKFTSWGHTSLVRPLHTGTMTTRTCMCLPVAGVACARGCICMAACHVAGSQSRIAAASTVSVLFHPPGMHHVHMQLYTLSYTHHEHAVHHRRPEEEPQEAWARVCRSWAHWQAQEASRWPR